MGDEPRLVTQRWGRRIYEQNGHLDGIAYRGAQQGGESLALWERSPELRRVEGGDRRLWAVWRFVVLALAGQRRRPRRIVACECGKCREYGYSR